MAGSLSKPHLGLYIGCVVYMYGTSYVLQNAHACVKSTCVKGRRLTNHTKQGTAVEESAIENVALPRVLKNERHH